MKTKSKIKQLVYKIGEFAFIPVIISILLFVILPKETASENGIHYIYAASAGIMGIYFFLNGFTKTFLPPQWEKVFPMLNSLSRNQKIKKRKVVVVIHSLMDICLILAGLAVSIDFGIDWRLILILALGLYIIGLFVRSRLPVAESYNWEFVYPELALAFDDDDEEE